MMDRSLGTSIIIFAIVDRLIWFCDIPCSSHATRQIAQYTERIPKVPDDDREYTPGTARSPNDSEQAPGATTHQSPAKNDIRGPQGKSTRPTPRPAPPPAPGPPPLLPSQQRPSDCSSLTRASFSITYPYYSARDSLAPPHPPHPSSHKPPPTNDDYTGGHSETHRQTDARPPQRAADSRRHGQ